MKQKKGFLSIILVLTILSSAFAFTVNAVTGASGETVYVRTTGSNPTCYMWTTSGGTTTNNGAWPGAKMTKVEDNIYSYTLTGSFENVIFNDSNGQTGNLVYQGANMLYDKSTGKWEQYAGSENPPTVTFSKKDGATYTNTVNVKITTSKATSASYKIDNGSAVSFSGETTVTIGEGVSVGTSTTISVTATNEYGTTNQSITLTKKESSQGGGGSDGSTTPAETGKYATNPNGKVGKKASITIDGDASDWSDDMLIAQGAAWDVANHWKGGHENCVLDTYSLYGAWDDDNLYIGWQMVNTTDTWAKSGDGPLSDGGRVLDVPLILALSIDNNSTKMSNKNTSGNPIWGQKMGLEFTTHVDRLLYMSGKPGLGEPAMFSAVDEEGNTNYTDGMVGFKNGGIEYKMATTCITDSIVGLNSSDDPQDCYDDGADWVDYKTFQGSAGTHDTKYDSFYEIKIPLDTLGIDSSYLTNNGIGAMLVATRGESALDCIPHDPSMLDNVMGDYSADPSTSAEKDDVDNITVPFAKIGTLGSTDPTRPTTPTVTTTTKPTTVTTTTKPTTVTTTTKPTTVTTTTKPTTATTVTEPTGILGDVNGDGVVNVKDATLIQKYAAEMTVELNLKLADYNKDGNVNVKDATDIQKTTAFLN
ncbi:starch-binding protein [uncultured Ruminococcus sp.]|uniref:starch-binding protein n=1 Tax=uncultured Ruminococcus sp. TaxID=165186 RepID=UPI0025898B9D|nr:starch-binding protein [uncultured Ruminococcus sp.]